MGNRDFRTNTLRVITLSLAIMIGILFSGIGYGGQIQPGQKRIVASGEELNIKGIILSRDGEMFVLRDITRTDTIVVLTDSTSIKSERQGLGLLPERRSKSFQATALLPGLILQVKGKGDSEGRLVADEIRFKESDLRAAVTASVRTAPVEDKSDKALRDIAETDKRISSLDQYDVVNVVTVLFAVNKTDLSAEAKAQLDELASKAPSAKNYTVEVQGFADSTGNYRHNMKLSQRRAEAVVQYLTVKHNIPLRRITIPMGYGETKAAADETTAAGRAKDRRVEVRILVNKGLSQQQAEPAAPPTKTE
ncbi:Outer membrane protein OmpA [Syntrophus gentianae]|uniref:Outer membrane protein OmpA n=1 Tax=Syntrophus gentianae TaxID=43775 RepID=A0A1H7VZ68_9BACT|nr:OmpA family protein [Syntrophus gentianae]SEM14088.1 Outer membrane protein OmpA [Syntrophus gentianae]